MAWGFDAMQGADDWIATRRARELEDENKRIAQMNQQRADQQLSMQQAEHAGRNEDRAFNRQRLEAQDAEQAAAQEQRGLFLGALPPEMQKAIQARQYGLTTATPHDFEDEATHGAHITAARDQKVADIKAEEGARAGFRQPPKEARSWVTRDGQPTRVSESEIQPGDTPYRPPTAPSDAAQQQSNDIDETLNLVEQIRTDPALARSVGPADQYAGKARSLLPGGIGVGDVTRFRALHNQLVGRLQLAQSGKLRGQGQLSDREREMLRQASTALTMAMEEGDYLAELQKVQEQFERMPRLQNVLGGAPPGAAKPPGLKVGNFEIIEE